MKFRAIALIVGGLFAASSQAQQCPAGLTGMPNCLPPTHPSSPHAQSSGGASRVYWKSQYAAVVMGKGGSGFTAMGPADSKRAAETAAMKACRERGGLDCKLIVSFGNQCAAISWGLTVRTVGMGPTLASAEADAVSRCETDTDDCRVYFSDCANPLKVRK